jgi:hypothetical protein
VDDGPWVAMAVFCEQVIEDKQGILTLVKVIDRLTVEAQASGVEPPAQLPPGTIQLTFVISVKAGNSKGRSEIQTDLEGPDGLTRPIASHSVNFVAPHYGTNLINRIALGFQHEGVYWFTVKADGKVLTRAPLEILYMRSATPSAGPPLQGTP